MKRRRVAWTVGMLVVLAGGLFGWIAVEASRVPTRRDMAHSTNNLRNLTALLIARANVEGWPPYEGKAFVLSLVATGDLATSIPENLPTLWSPFDPSFRRDRLAALPYGKVTKEALASGMDVRGLTSYVGPRHAETLKRLGISPNVGPVPVLADLHVPDGAIVAFSNQQVKFLRRKELGLGPDDPIVAGDGSKSPILRQLTE
jgi:hypothetical protein